MLFDGELFRCAEKFARSAIGKVFANQYARHALACEDYILLRSCRLLDAIGNSKGFKGSSWDLDLSGGRNLSRNRAGADARVVDAEVKSSPRLQLTCDNCGPVDSLIDSIFGYRALYGRHRVAISASAAA